MALGTARAPVGWLPYSPVAFATAVVLINAAVRLTESGGLELRPLSGAAAMLSSPPMLCCAAAVAAGCSWACRAQLPRVDRLAAIWHLVNATFFFFGCDVMSGLFGVVPAMSEQYLTMDRRHERRRHELDAMYWAELAVHIPFSAAVFYGYVSRSAWTPLLESFLGGVTLLGTLAYYVPELLTGGHNWLPGAVGVATTALGGVWIAVPLCLLARSVRQGGGSAGESWRAR